jgi:hypothetical protein
MKPVVVAITLLIATPGFAQDAQYDRVMTAVRAAMAPALPFPATAPDGSVPVNNNTEALWMIAADQDSQTISIVANPLNAVVQLRATRAMAQIDNNIQAAQRRATAQYEAAVAEARRTGRSQNVDGVSLNDEGVAGERIDAESYASISVEFHEREYRFLVPGSMEPSRVESFPIADTQVLTVPGHLYRDEAGIEHFAESHRIILMGRNLDARVTKSKDGVFVVTAVATTAATEGLDTLTLHIRGNSELGADLLAKTNWTQLLELLK